MQTHQVCTFYSQGHTADAHAHAWSRARSDCYPPVLKLSCNEYRFLLSLQRTIGTNSVCARAQKHLCPRSGEHRMRLHSPLCVSPPAWQMHLLSKSWWIYRLNSKSKAHSRSRRRGGAVGGTRRRVPSAIPRTSAGNHSSTRPQLGRRHRFGLLSSPRGAAVMNGNEMLPVFMNISYQQCQNASSFCAIVIPPLPPTFLQQKTFSNCRSLTFSPLVFPFSFSLSQAIGVHFFTSHLNHLSLITYCSLDCRSLSLPFYFSPFFLHLCTRRCLVARMTIISSGKRFFQIYFTRWWIFSVDSSFHAWLSNLTCAY